MPKGWLLRYYCIAFIDVLGQSDKLLKLDRLPTNQEEKNQASQILNETAGNINRLRNGFRAFYRKRSESTGILDGLSPDARAKAEQARRVDIIVNNVSDAIILAVPLDIEFDHCVSVGSIYSTLYGISGLLSTGLVKGDAGKKAK